MQITLGLNELAASLQTAGKNDSRKYLNAICLEVTPTKALLISANGGMLSAILPHSTVTDTPDEMLSAILPHSTITDTPDEMPNDTRQFLIPRELAEQVIKSFNKNVTIDIAFTLENTVTISQGTTAFSSKIIDQKFPDWRHLIPSGGQIPSMGNYVDPQYLVAFAKIAVLLGYKNQEISLNQFSNATEGALFVDMGIPNLFGIIMPKRNLPGNTRRDTIPEWL